MIKTLFLLTFCLVSIAETAHAGGDIAAGEIIFQRCIVCHGKLDPAHPERMGPSLQGMIGRPVASVEGYAYSNAMKSFGATGAKWDEATLDQFLKSPMDFVKGTKMMVPGARRDTERADLIAFLKAGALMSQ